MHRSDSKLSKNAVVSIYVYLMTNWLIPPKLTITTASVVNMSATLSVNVVFASPPTVCKSDRFQ